MTELDDYGRLKARERLLSSINDIKAAARRLQRIKGIETRPQEVKLGIVAGQLEKLRKGLDR